MAEQSAKPKKRQVKDPETFRERASKATETSEQPKRRRVVLPSTSLLRAIFGPIGRSLARLFHWKPFRILGKILFLPYFSNSWKELRLVNWPNWREGRRLTFAVLIFAIVFGAVIAGVDFGLDKVFKQLLLK